MRNKWKMLTLAVSIILLSILLYRFYSNKHNIDLGYNFRAVSNCDYVSTTECKSYMDLYINSYQEMDFDLIGIIAISLFIGIAFGTND